MKTVLVAVLLALAASASARRHHRPYKSAGGEDSEDVVVDVGSPVILTPLLEAGQIAEAQNASRVAERMGGVDSYSAFLTVNKELNSNLFFWFFPAEKGMEKAPVVLWLQGGPGSSSLLGLFVENGPFRLHNSRRKGRRHRLKRRKQAWTRAASMLYVDSPVGAGFSFTDSEDGYARSEEDVGRNLLRALEQFFQLFPQLRSNEFFIAGESYAGKYIPALGMAIHTAESEQKINLKGMAIGNPLSDPETMLDYGVYMHQLGLLDDHGLALFKSKEDDIRQLIGDKKWGEAQAARDALVGVRNVTSLFKELTGFKFRFNYLHDTDYLQRGYVSYVQSPEVRAMLHVGNATFHNGTQVLKHLWTDVMQSVKPWVEQLLANYDMLFYNGQLDLADPYPMMVNFLKRLEWSGAKDYQDARRKLWIVDGDLAGYSKTAGRLTEVLVRAAGHMVPTDQPRWALDLITRFTTHQPF